MQIHQQLYNDDVTHGAAATIGPVSRGGRPALLSPVVPWLCLALLVLSAACSMTPEQTIFDLLEPCTSKEGPSFGLCGIFEVAENPAEPDGKSIALKVVVIPALDSEPSPDPVFFLAGGPGQGSAALAGRIGRMFDPIRRDRDIVFVDQRGTGESNRLECNFYEAYKEMDDIIDVPLPTQADIDQCLAELDGDPRFYTTTIAVDDLDKVREWLGYDYINPMGSSYGTRAALVYLQRHPERVRSVILDGVAPPDMTLPLYFPRDVQRALDQLTEACRKNADCNSQFPQLGDKLNHLLVELDRNPQQLTLTHPRTGEEIDATITRRFVALTLFGVLYSPLKGSLVPLAIDRASDGDFSTLVTLAHTGEGLEDEIASGMFLAVTCSEDYPRLADGAIDAESASTFVGRNIYDVQWKPCEFWPRGEVDDSFYEPIKSDLPILILSGELDPVTPPSWGEHVAQHLPNSRHIIAPGTGHGVMAVGCTMRLIAQFLDEETAANLDASCLDNQARPPFFVNNAGPYLPQEEDIEE